MMQKENCEKRKDIQKEHRGLCSEYHTVKPVLSSHSKMTPKIGFQDRLSLNAVQNYCRMLQGEHSTILLTFIKLPFFIKAFFCLFWVPLKTGFTVLLIVSFPNFYPCKIGFPPMRETSFCRTR